MPEPEVAATGATRGQILHGNEFVHSTGEAPVRGLGAENTFLASCTCMDAFFDVSSDGSVSRDLRPELVRELLTYLQVTVSSAVVRPGEPPKFYRVVLHEENMKLLRTRAAEDPDGPFARLLEVDAAVDAVLRRSGSGTDFFVVAPPGCTPDSPHADMLLLPCEQERGRSRLVSKDAAGHCMTLCSTRFRAYPEHKDGLMLQPRMEAVAKVPCGLGGGHSYASDAVECAVL